MLSRGLVNLEETVWKTAELFSDNPIQWQFESIFLSMALFLTFTWAGESCINMYSQSVSRAILSLSKFSPRFPLTELVTYCYHAPTPYDAESGNRTWVTLVGGKSSYHCAIPAPLDKTQSLLNRVLSAFTYLFFYFFLNYLITYFYILIAYSFSTLLSSFLCSFASAFFLSFSPSLSFLSLCLSFILSFSLL